MCQTRAWEELSIYKRGLENTIRIPRVSLRSDLLKCDQCDAEVVVKGLVTHEECTREGTLSKKYNLKTYNDKSIQADMCNVIAKDMSELDIKSSLEKDALPLYEELGPSSGMETLDVRVGLSKLRMEKEKEEFHRRQSLHIVPTEEDEGFEEYSYTKYEETRKKWTSTLDIRGEIFKSRLSREKDNFYDVEPILESVFQRGKCLEVSPNTCLDELDDPETKGKDQKRISSERCLREDTVNRKLKGKSITKLLFRKLDRLTHAFLCKS